MDDNEYLRDLYFGNLYDFANKEDCIRLQRKNSNLQISEQPMFSIMMCVYNDVSLLNSAINSLLKQNYTNWELIILDNSDKNENAWKMIQNAADADPRIHAYKSEQNVGWPKGASICLQHVRGSYTTFLSADDCINVGALGRLSEIIEEENPDIIWVGDACVAYHTDSSMELLRIHVPDYKIYGEKNRSESIVKILKTVDYNSFFHYMKVEFLKENGIDFYEPYYADCAGMTKSMVEAKKMVVLDEIVYFLTMNTSQTVGRYTWDSYDFVFVNQWKCLKKIFKKEKYANQEDIQYSAARILNNLLGNIGILCQGHCRNSYMQKIEKEPEEIVRQLEEIMACDDITEMLQLVGSGYFEKLLSAVAEIEKCGISFNTDVVQRSWLKNLITLALKKEEVELEKELEWMIYWLLEENNTRSIGFEYCLELLKRADNQALLRFQEEIREIAAKWENQSMNKLFYRLY